MLALLLHAHLPFVRHPEHAHFLEEDWLFEAITETYLPLTSMLYRLAEEGLPFRLAMTVTPTLGAMLRDPLLLSRYDAYLDRLTAFAESEARRLSGAGAESARFALLRLMQVREWWEDIGRDLPGALGGLQQHGLELVASAVTHGFLPLMARRGSVKAQIASGVAEHRAMFGRDPAGFWLPECAFTPGLDDVLAEHGIRWTALDSHGLMRGHPAPRNAVWNPVFTPSGVAAFGRDRESARQVWNAAEGFPGHADYREFYRDAGWDAPLDAALPFLPDGMRKFTGLKLHRITGREEKEFYDRAAAMRTAKAHAAEFVAGCAARISELRDCLDAPPVIFAPFDAELFGHWWFEGPDWLEFVLRECCASKLVPLTSPAAYLAGHDTHQIVEPAASSWGDGGHWGVWLDPVNAWVYRDLHAAEHRIARMIRDSAECGPLSPLKERALRHAARELLLAQASDWAFLMKAGTAREYSEKRVRAHIANFNRLAAEIEADAIDANRLGELERDAAFGPPAGWRHFGLK